MGENVRITICSSCKDLNSEFQIKLPSDLRKAIVMTQDNLADGAISDIIIWDVLAVAWEGVGGARASAFSDVPYLEIRGATDTADHEAPIVFYINLKVVMKNIAYLLIRWLKHSENPS